jgi:glycosyltransferase involved in cell wall biosynthesis
MTLPSKIIAYLAPEIPGLSSTFVYNEIFALTAMGFDIKTFSVHKSDNYGADPRLHALTKTTVYLYEQGFFPVLKSNIAVFFRNPCRYLKTLCSCLSDLTRLWGKPMLALGVLFRFFMGASLARYLILHRVSHLHIHFAHIPTDLGMYAAALTNIPYSVTAHANDIFQRGWLLKQKVARSAFFATISNFNVRWLIELGADKDKLVVVRCGVDSSQFTTRPNKIKSSPVVFGFLGRLIEKKGAEVLIAACARLEKTHANYVVQLVGDGPLLEALTQQVASLDLQDKILFLGAKPHAEISSWLDALDYFVLPCVKDSEGDMDGIPVALMEAMLKGVPVISSDISGIPELVIHEKTGLSVVNHNIFSLADALIMAIDEGGQSVMSRVKAAQDYVRAEYDLTLNAQRLGELITSTAKRPVL